MYSKIENRNHQVYSTCNYDPDHDVENWLLIPAIERGEAQRLYLDFNFTIIRCATVKELRISSCKETLKLYAVQLDRDATLPNQNWHNETKWCPFPDSNHPTLFMLSGITSTHWPHIRQTLRRRTRLNCNRLTRRPVHTMRLNHLCILHLEIPVPVRPLFQSR